MVCVYIFKHHSLEKSDTTMPAAPPSKQYPLDDIRSLLALMPEADYQAEEAVIARDKTLTKPEGALGRMEDFVRHLARWQGLARPQMQRPMVVIFAGNHGIATHGVSAYPPSVTKAMVENFRAGGAAINQICECFGFGLKIFELALDKPTQDFTKMQAMDDKTTTATIAYGMEAAADNTDFLMLGEMGIGNTTAAAALYYALFGGAAKDWVGRGSGVDDAGLARKIAVVEEAVERHRPHCTDSLDWLAAVGGREIAALVGAILAARLQRIPVVLDGYVVCAAAAVLHALTPATLVHCLAGHVGAEGAHRAVLWRLGLDPILDLDLRLGEASGAALAGAIIKAALGTFNGMASFDAAGVPKKL